jgi:hypothetical protein
VSDWARDSDSALYSPKYEAATDHKRVINLSVENSDLMIAVSGWERDTLKFVGGVLELPDGIPFQDFVRILGQWYRHAYDKAMDHAVAYPQDERQEAYVRTIVGNRVSDEGERPKAEQCRELWETAQQYFSGVEEAHAAAERLEKPQQSRPGQLDRFKWLRQSAMASRELFAPAAHQAIMDVTSRLIEDELVTKRFAEIDAATSTFFWFSDHLPGNRFCITTDGRTALVPGGARKGDIVCVMKGAQMPLLLRRSKEERAEGGQHKYQLVGCCYVHGLMERGYTDDPATLFVLV